MNAVGIDVSKGKSTVTIRRPGDIVLMPPCDIPHTQSAINALMEQIKSLDGETKVCMEHTGRYYEPVANWLSDAGIFVSAVNPILIRDFGDDYFYHSQVFISKTAISGGLLNRGSFCLLLPTPLVINI